MPGRRRRRPGPATPGRFPFTVAATGAGRTGWHFNGKIERPFVAAGSLTPGEVGAIADGHAPAGIVAAWDFSRDISSPRVPDIGPHGLDGVLVNLPTRAMTGSAWDGSGHDWTRRPAHYGAVHFHGGRSSRLRLGDRLHLHGARGHEERCLRRAACAPRRVPRT